MFQYSIVSSVAAYPAVKGWFDSVAQSDGHELILVKAPDAAAKSAEGQAHAPGQ